MKPLSIGTVKVAANGKAGRKGQPEAVAAVEVRASGTKVERPKE